MNGQLPLHQNLKTTTPSRDNKQFVKIAIYNARNTTFVYISIHEQVPTLLLNVTTYKHIHLVIKYINSHQPWPESYSSRTIKCPYEVSQCWEWGNILWSKSLRENTTTAAMKEDIQRDMDHLYVLLDQCTYEDIL